MDRSIVLQVINGYVAVTVAYCTFIFARYFVNNWRLGYFELRAAIAILTLCAFEVILRAPQFIARTLANMGYVVGQPNVTLIIGGIGVEAAFLCFCRVFSPQKWGIWSWVVPFVLSTVVVAISLFLVYDWRFL